jgi:hypothetical protein
LSTLNAHIWYEQKGTLMSKNRLPQYTAQSEVPYLKFSIDK